MAESETGSVKSSILMRVEDDADKKTKGESGSNDNKQDQLEINQPQIYSPVKSNSVLTSIKLGNTSLVTTNNTLNSSNFGAKSILKPPKLGCNSNVTSVKTPFVLNPSRLNPLSKVPAEESKSDISESDKTIVNSSATNGETPKFVPLLHTEKKTSELVKPVTSVLSTAQVNQNNFVFGQNLQDRVIADSNDDPKPSTSCVCSNGTSEMLFSSVIKDSVKLDNSESTSSKEMKSLSEFAKEYEESRAIKRKYEEVEIKTGEEDETNILHVSCKLFSYDKSSGSWQERGRGNLRLNDLEGYDNCNMYKQSRIVFRTSGSLRVILNTKIWADMTIQQSSAKSIRLTALDSSGEIKVFLIMASAEEISKLYKLLEDRLKREMDRQHHKKLNTFTDISQYIASE